MTDSSNFEKNILELKERMNQMLGNYYPAMGQAESLYGVDWIPAVDILEDKDDIIVKADIPGMTANGINLSISSNVLNIKGERIRDVVREDENYHAIECGYGKFDRRITLPTSVDIDKIMASYKDGVLTVRIPKLEKTNVGEIKIRPE